jgi:hypothetical protein
VEVMGVWGTAPRRFPLIHFQFGTVLCPDKNENGWEEIVGAQYLIRP